MVPQFAGLDENAQELLTDAIPLITILIAGADGKIEKKEKEWAAKVMKIRTYKHPKALDGYYAHAGYHFSDRLEQMISDLPSDVDERNKIISDKLVQLNDVFPKMSQVHAGLLYKSFSSFAKHVAQASGGFLGFASISLNEARLVKLPMVNPVELPHDYIEDEEE